MGGVSGTQSMDGVDPPGVDDTGDLRLVNRSIEKPSAMVHYSCLHVFSTLRNTISHVAVVAYSARVSWTVDHGSWNVNNAN